MFFYTKLIILLLLASCTQEENTIYRHKNIFKPKNETFYISGNYITPVSMQLKSAGSLNLVDFQNITTNNGIQKYENIIHNTYGINPGLNLNSSKFGLSLAFGRKMSSGFRLEGAIEFIQGRNEVSKSTFTDKDEATGQSAFAVEYKDPTTGEVVSNYYRGVQAIYRHISVMMNTYYDFLGFRESENTIVRKFTPYIGLGVGVASDFGYLRAYNQQITTSLSKAPSGEYRTDQKYFNKASIDLTLSGMGGIRYAVSPSIELDCKFAYKTAINAFGKQTGMKYQFLVISTGMMFNF